MMNQEDVLRELELLPVWQSRVPAIKVPTEAIPIEVPEAKILEVVEPESLAELEVSSNQEATEKYTFRCIVSEDAQWLFVLQQQSEAAEILLQNILKAVSVKVGQELEVAGMVAVSQLSTKVIVVMGEEVSQQLLTVTQPLAELRGKPHVLNHRLVIATYAPEALLDNWADKSKAWEDLCLARAAIANL